MVEMPPPWDVGSDLNLYPASLRLHRHTEDTEAD